MLRYHVKQGCEHGHIVNRMTTRGSKQSSDNVHPIAEGLFMLRVGNN